MKIRGWRRGLSSGAALGVALGAVENLVLLPILDRTAREPGPIGRRLAAILLRAAFGVSTAVPLLVMKRAKLLGRR